MAGKNISVLSGQGYAILAGFFPAVCKENNSDLDTSCLFTWRWIRSAIESLKMMACSLIVLDVFNHETEGATSAVGEFIADNLTWPRNG